MAAQILYCDCAYARVLPPETKAAVLEGLTRSGVAFEAVPDLCEMAARRDPRLAELTSADTLRIAACYPRAVKWLLASAGADIGDADAVVCNMRTESAEEVLQRMLPADTAGRKDPPYDSETADACAARPVEAGLQNRLGGPQGLPLQQQTGTPGAWKPWFPVIDYERCTNCMQCLSFCLFDVYGVSADRKIQVQNQSNCKTECPACSRVCPEVAIMFPKYRHGPINGERVSDEDVRREAMKVDISALLGGDVYALLRDRSARAKSRFSKERDDERALKERQTCLAKLQQSLDVPAEVLAALPTADEIRARAEAAAARAEGVEADLQVRLTE